MSLNKYAAIRYRIIDECIRSRSKPWPTKQELRSACEQALYGSGTGSYEVKLFVIPSDELKMQILSYGSKVEVVKPDWLRNEIKVTLEKAVERYFR